MSSRRRISVALVGLIALVIIGWFVRDHSGDTATGTLSKVPGAAESGLSVRALTSLSPEVDRTWQPVPETGPYPYPYPGQDGTVFGNREGEPSNGHGDYYHQHTVPTPGSADRGDRRLVTGERPEVYYTSDHDEAFVVVDAAS